MAVMLTMMMGVDSVSLTTGQSPNSAAGLPVSDLPHGVP
jgi:hypothetical protein